ncbi:MAG: MarR family transcriptional regulator [Armatimonadetes bacterium]|nr:MarR family transcriptional regulator [Anaerolineae bacterium]
MPEAAASSKSTNEQIARRTLDIIPLVMRVMSAEMRHGTHGVAANHAPILGILEMRPHTLSELAERASVSAPTMSTTITTLEERGWVVRRRSETDRRVVWVEIAQPGRDALAVMQHDVQTRIAQLLTGLSTEQQTALVEGLTVLRDVFAAALEQDPILRKD